MRRAPLFLTLVLAALIVPATAASAKCMPGEDGCLEVTMARATVTGPGLGAPIVIDDDDFWSLARQAGLDSYRPRGLMGEPDDAPLGPRYLIHFVVRISDGREFKVTRQVYPYAVNTIVEGVPVAWSVSTRPQKFIEAFDIFVGGRFTVDPGWYRSASLYRTLVDHGLPAGSPVPVTAPTVAPAPGADSVASDPATTNEPSIWLVLALLAALAALLVGGAVAGRPRSRPSLP
jgi:hypothetical protein